MNLKWLHLKYGWVFKWNWVLGWLRLEGGQVRENKSFWKTVYINPLKLKTHVFRGLASRKVTREKCLWRKKLFAGRLYSQNNSETIAKVSVWFLCFHDFVLTHFRGKCLVASFSRKSLWRSFLMKNIKNAI